MHAGESRIPRQRGKGVGCWHQADFVYFELDRWGYESCSQRCTCTIQQLCGLMLAASTEKPSEDLTARQCTSDSCLKDSEGIIQSLHLQHDCNAREESSFAKVLAHPCIR